MMQHHKNTSGGNSQKKGSSSRSTSRMPPSKESGETGILKPKPSAEKRPLEDLSSATSDDDAKRPKLLPETNPVCQNSDDEGSEDSDSDDMGSEGPIDYQEEESDDDDDDDSCESCESEADDETGSITGSDTLESKNEDPATVDTASQSSSRNDLTEELSSMSFEELLQLRNRVGIKAYQQMTTREKAQNATKAEKKHCSNKHRPLEISAKKPVPFLRRIVPVKKKVPRDPRFDSLSGEYKPEIFEKTYGFLNDIRKNEKEAVQKQLKKSRNVEQKDKLQWLLKRMTQQEEAQMKQQKEREKNLVLKRQQRELAQQGKKPFYLKKSDKQRLELAQKYKELKKSGKLESFLSKKRKRNAAKDKRRLPFRKDV